MPDPIFADPRLARIYDDLDPDRSDLDAYLGLAEELGARRLLDVGCGTGTFAVLAAARGLEVVRSTPPRHRSTSPGARRTPTGCGGSTATPRRCRRWRWTSRR